jgi:copper(I)-binding protein
VTSSVTSAVTSAVKTGMPRLVLVVALLLPLNAFAELDITEARIKNLPPSVPVRAGYLSIHNSSAISVSVVAIRSDGFASVEIHRSVMQDGMMRMEPVDSLTIDPGTSLQLAPGGLHLMMMHPAEATRPGDDIEVILQLDDGSEQRLMMKVIK